MINDTFCYIGTFSRLRCSDTYKLLFSSIKNLSIESQSLSRRLDFAKSIWKKKSNCTTVRAVWFAVVAGTGAGTAGIASTNNNCATTTRRRHSVASHPHSVNNSQSVHVTTSTTTTTITTTITITTTATVTTTTTTATISHQRTLSLPLAAIINQMQSSKRSVLRCMYFCFVVR